MPGAPGSPTDSLRNSVAAFARAELNEGVVERDRDRVFPRDLWTKCGSQRLQGMIVPEEYGGLGLDALSAVAALEGLGFGCRDGGLSFAICAHLRRHEAPLPSSSFRRHARRGERDDRTRNRI